MARYTLHVNGARHEVDADPSTPLVYILRNHLGLTGTKMGCAKEQCGACAVLVDGEAVMSCVRRGGDFAGASITTVEGLATAGRLSRVQHAFVETGATQCGYCAPGLVIAVTALLRRSPQPTRAEVIGALNRHLCRCGSHGRVLAAIRLLTGEKGSVSSA